MQKENDSHKANIQKFKPFIRSRGSHSFSAAQNPLTIMSPLHRNYNSTTTSLKVAEPLTGIKERMSGSVLKQIKSPTSSEAVTLKKEVGALNKQLQSLQKQFEKLNEKHSSSMLEFKKARVAQTSQKEEIAILEKLLEKVGEEKENLETVVAQNKEYIRKLERTVTKGTSSGNPIAEANLSLSYENEKLREEQTKMMEKITSYEEKEKENAKEILVLKRALEFKTTDFKVAKNGDLRSSLLYDVGKNREELSQCQKELNKLKEENKELVVLLEGQRKRKEELELIRESNNEAFINVEKELIEEKAAHKKEALEADKLRNERVALLEYIEEVQQLQEAEATQKEEEIERFSQKIRQLESSDFEKNALLGQKDHTIQDLVSQLAQLEGLNSNIAKQYEAQQEGIMHIQQSQKYACQKSETMEKEYEKLQREFQILKKREEALSKQHAHAVDKMDTQTKEIERMTEHNKDLEYTLKITAQAQNKSEKGLKEKLERTLTELEDVVSEKKEMREHSAQALRTVELLKREDQNLRRENERLQEQLTNVMNGKSLMQRTLTDQLQSMQEITKQSREDRKQKYLENEELQLKISELEKKNRDQLEEIRKLRRITGR